MPSGPFLDNLGGFIFFKTDLFGFTGEQFHRAPQAIMPEVELVAIFVSHLFKSPYHIKMPTT